MKVNKLIILFIASALPFINGCEWVIDNDETKGSYEISVFPIFTIEGEDFVSLQVGNAYTGPIVKASEIEEGGNDLAVYIESVTRLNVVENAGEYELVSTVLETVDMSVAGVNVVTYAAENKFGYKRNAFAAAAVASEDVNLNPDLTGDYKKGATIINVSKYANGIWFTTDVYPASSFILPSRFGDIGNGYYIIPPTSTEYGTHEGYVILESNGNLTIYALITKTDGSTKKTTNTWVKQ